MRRILVAAIFGVAVVGAAACVLDRGGLGDAGDDGFGGKASSPASSSSSAKGSSTEVSSSSAAPSCVDGVKNGEESDVDCGGTCPGCGYGAICGSTTDCANGTCTSGFCVPESVLAWREVVTATAPSPRIEFAISEDAMGHAILLGGCDTTETTASNDQWIFDGITWSAYLGALPEKRHAATMVYDSARAKVVLFGGGDPGIAFLSDTWEWDGTSWTKVAVTGPSGRYHAAAAFDPHRGVTVVFGGSNGGLFNDTWEYDGVGWKQASPTALPPARRAHQMVYDAKSERVLMFGGVDGTNQVLDDTWSWDGVDWKDVTPAPGSDLPARTAAAVLADPETGEVIVHGGVSVAGAALTDTWAWDGAAWTQLASTPPDDPGATVFDAMAFVGPAHHAVLFSTWDGQVTSESTWELFSVGGACGDPAECGSAACVDHLCCQRVCTSCESCATDATPGFCAAIDAGAGCDAGD